MPASRRAWPGSSPQSAGTPPISTCCCIGVALSCGWHPELTLQADNTALLFQHQPGHGPKRPVSPLNVQTFDNLLANPENAGVEIRPVPNLSILKDAWPELVVEVAFSGWSRDGLVRQASFQELREDKRVEEVIREN